LMSLTSIYLHQKLLGMMFIILQNNCAAIEVGYG